MNFDHPTAYTEGLTQGQINQRISDPLRQLNLSISDLQGHLNEGISDPQGHINQHF